MFEWFARPQLVPQHPLLLTTFAANMQIKAHKYTHIHMQMMMTRLLVGGIFSRVAHTFFAILCECKLRSCVGCRLVACSFRLSRQFVSFFPRKSCFLLLLLLLFQLMRRVVVLAKTMCDVERVNASREIQKIANVKIGPQ